MSRTRICGLIGLALGLLLFPGSTRAQTQGTVSIDGTVGIALKLSFWDATVIGSTSGNNPHAQDELLAYTMNVGEVGPSNTNNYEGGRVRIALRSNDPDPYLLDAQITAQSGFGSSANGEIELSDIGFGIAEVVCNGSNCQESNTTNSFPGAPATAPVLKSHGVPMFAHHLGELATAPPATTVLRGDRISLRGSFSSPSNALLVATEYAIGPQMWAPTTFSATVTYTLTAP